MFQLKQIGRLSYHTEFVFLIKRYLLRLPKLYSKNNNNNITLLVWKALRCVCMDECVCAFKGLNILACVCQFLCASIRVVNTESGGATLFVRWQYNLYCYRVKQLSWAITKLSFIHCLVLLFTLKILIFDTINAYNLIFLTI